MARGLYKLIWNLPDNSAPEISIDLRDADYCGTRPPYVADIDLYIRWNEYERYFEYKNYYTNGNWEFLCYNLGSLKIWKLYKIKDGNENKQSLQPTSPNDFHCTNKSSWNHHPHFTWLKPSQPTGVTFKYFIYRSENNGPFSCVASNLTTREWTDNSIFLTRGGVPYEYYVTAKGPQSPESEPSNSDIIRGSSSKPLPNNSNSNNFAQTVQNIKLFVCPNPFNPETQISYNLPRESRVTLSVYNIAGQKVATLVAGRQSAGTHTAIFAGKSLPAGVYLVSLQSGRENHLQKVLLVK